MRWLWIAAVAITVLGALADLAAGASGVVGIITGMCELTLLLLPVTREHFAKELPPAL